MYSRIKIILSLLDSATTTKIYVFSIFRILLGLIDVIGVLLIGLLLAKTVSGVEPLSKSSEIKLPDSIKFINELNLVQLALLATSAFIVKSLFSAFLTKIMMRNFADIEVKIATQSFKYFLNNISWTTKNYSKSDLNYLLSSSVIAAMQMLAAYVTVISEVFFLILMIISFALINFNVTIFMIIYFLIIAFLLHSYLGKRFEDAGNKNVKAGIQTTTTIFDTVESYREVISLKKEKFFLDKFYGPKLESSRASFDIQYLNALPRYIVESALLIGALGIIFLSFRSGNLVDSAQTIGVFLTGATKMMASLLPLQTYFAHFRHQIKVAEKFFDFQEETNAINFQDFETPSEHSKVNIQGPVGVRIKNLNFSYRDSKDLVLEDINLTIAPGRSVAIIGPSGSGKSTLADLIVGIDRPTVGEIHYFIDNTEIDRSEVRFGYVPQSPGNVYGSLRENIAFGEVEIELNTNSLNQAINMAHLRDLVSNLPDGINAHLGEQSDALSGGQLQRIGLARALYVQPNLLVLDEATSALDVETEFAVTESLARLKGLCTVVVIAHRLSTVQNADTVYVVDQGKIVASGKFADLAAENEIVAKFVELSDLNPN